MLLIPFLPISISIPVKEPSFYNPPSLTSKTFVDNMDNLPPLKLAINALVQEFKIQESQIVVASNFTTNAGFTHLYFQHVIDGTAVLNHNAAVHIYKGAVVYSSCSFCQSLQKRSFPHADIAWNFNSKIAVHTLYKQLGLAPSTPPNKCLIESDQGVVIGCYLVKVRDFAKSLWMDVVIDSKSGKKISSINYAHHATYNAFDLPKHSPEAGFEYITNPEDPKASPNGWRSEGKLFEGNNVAVSVAGIPSVDDLQNEKNGWSAAEPPTTIANQKAAAEQLFFLVNKMHDIFYHYGFIEAAGNFQKSNNQPGGAPGDNILVKSQYGIDYDSFFVAGPDGEPGILQLSIFDTKRDASLDSTIVLHELMHGVSNRLTGGKRDGTCLTSDVSAGLDEGWSDTLAVIFTYTDSSTRDTKTEIASYANLKGLRRMPYSSNPSFNSLKISDLNLDSSIYAIGEVWASLLVDVYWNLIEKYGYSSNFYDETQLKGNIISLRLIIAGLTIQPCNPNLIQARDAILQADNVLYSGSEFCAIWKGFAKRGLGLNAKAGEYKDSFEVPEKCQ
jgi:hypothetical protein